MIPQCLLTTFLCVLALTQVQTQAHAQQYNTQKSENATACSKKDMIQIKKFNRFMVRKIKKYKTCSENTTGCTQKEIKESVEGATEMHKILISETYENMKDIYKRCGMQMATVNDEMPFWMPDNFL